MIEITPTQGSRDLQAFFARSLSSKELVKLNRPAHRRNPGYPPHDSRGYDDGGGQ